MYKSMTEMYFNRFAQSEAPRNRPAFTLVISKFEDKGVLMKTWGPVRPPRVEEA